MRRRLDKRLIDEAFEAYLEWRGECITLERAYGFWSGAGRYDARGAFWAYRAALEREEHAARRYGRLLTGLGSLSPDRGGRAVRTGRDTARTASGTP